MAPGGGGVQNGAIKRRTPLQKNAHCQRRRALLRPVHAGENTPVYTIWQAPASRRTREAGEGIYGFQSIKLVRAMAPSSARSVPVFHFQSNSAFPRVLISDTAFRFFHGGGVDFLRKSPGFLPSANAVQLSGVVAFAGRVGNVGTVGFPERCMGMAAQSPPLSAFLKVRTPVNQYEPGRNGTCPPSRNSRQ